MEKKSLWRKILKELEETSAVKELSLNAWIRPLKPLHFSNGILLLHTSNSFGIDLLNRQYREIILDAAKQVNPTVSAIRFTIEEDVPVPKGDQTSEKEKPAPLPKEEQQEKPSKKEKQEKNPPKKRANLNRGFTFDTFFTDQMNLFTLKGAMAVTENLGKIEFNPLYIYGESGVGKSHLLHAVGNKVVREHPNFSIVLTTAEEFFYSYSSIFREGDYGSRDKKLKEFFNIFLTADLLLIDEVHRFSGRIQCQVELIKIFNHCHQQNRQLVFTADRPPEELTGIQQSLISRLQWGLSLEIKPPTVATRKVILEGMAKEEKLALPTEVVNYIAEEGNRNIRELKGAVIRLAAYASIYHKSVDRATAEEVLNKTLDQQHGEEQGQTEFTIARILSYSADHYAVTEDMVKGKGRSKEVALARQMGMYLAKNHTSLSLKNIGQEFGGRNHSTVVHAIKSVEKKLTTDTALQNDVKHIIKKMSQI